jgi:hypothetical protein
VRFGKKGEALKLLNEQTVHIDENVLAITDGSGPIASMSLATASYLYMLVTR